MAKIILYFQLEDHSEAIPVLADRFPNIGEIVILPPKDYLIAEIRNHIGPTSTGLAYEVSMTTFYCIELAEPPSSEETTPTLPEGKP